MRFLIIATMGLFASGCDPAAPREPRDAAQAAATTEAVANAAITRDVANIQADVARTSEAQRLDELERRIGQLETTPDKLELELLASRVQALEAKAGADALAATPIAVPSGSPTAARTPAPARKPSPTAKPLPRPRPSPTTTAPTSPKREPDAG